MTTDYVETTEEMIELVASDALRRLDDGEAGDVYAAVSDAFDSSFGVYEPYELVAIMQVLDDGLHEGVEFDHDYALEEVDSFHETVFGPVQRMFYDGFTTYVVDYLRLVHGDDRPELYK